MPSPKEAFRALSPQGLHERQRGTRTRMEGIEDRLDEIDTGFERLHGLLAQAQAAGAETDNFQLELEKLEDFRKKLEDERLALGEISRDISGKNRRIEALEKKTIPELFAIYEQQKALYPKDKEAVLNPAAERFQKALTYLEKRGLTLIDAMVVPYENQTQHANDLMKGLAGLGLDDHALRAAIEEFNENADRWNHVPDAETSTKRKADGAVRKAKNHVKDVLTNYREHLIEGLRTANKTGAATGDPTSKNELTEELVWIEHVLAKKLADSKEKDAYVEEEAKKARETQANKHLAEKLGDPEKQKQFAKDILKALGVPLTTDDLREIFERRKSAAAARVGGGRRGGGQVTPYNEDRFGEEMADEILYQIEPSVIEEHKRNDVRRRIQDRHIPLPCPFPRKVIELLGLSIDDGTQASSVEKLGAVLTSLVQPVPPTPGEERTFQNVDGKLEKICDAFQESCQNPTTAKKVLETFLEAETARLSLDRRPIESKISRLQQEIKKSEKMEAVATGMRTELSRVAAFIDEELNELGKKIQKEDQLQEAATAVTAKIDALQSQRTIEQKNLEKGFDTRISQKQTDIEAAVTRINEIETSRLRDLTKEHDQKTGELTSKKARLATVEKVLAKISDARTGKFVFKDPSVLTTPEEVAFLKEDGKDAKISSVNIQRAKKESAVTAFEFLTRYQAEISVGFFQPELLSTYPAELTAKPATFLRTESARILRKCELIEEGKIAAKVALDVLANGHVPTLIEPGPRPTAYVLKTLKDWIQPTPGFFDRSSPLRKAYEAWKKEREEDEKINRDRVMNNEQALAKWKERIATANRTYAEWSDRLISLANVLMTQAPNLAPPAIDLTKEDEDLRQEVAAACVEALKPMLLDHHFLGQASDSTRMLEVAQAKIEELQNAEVNKYKNVIPVARDISGTLRKIQGMQREFDDYVQTRKAQRITLHQEVQALERDSAPLTQERTRLEAQKKSLETQKDRLEQEKQEIEADKTKQIEAFTKQTQVLVEQLDGNGEVETWRARSFDYHEEQDELRRNLKRLILDSVKRLNDWNDEAGEYAEPGSEGSIAYRTAYRDVKKSSDRLKRFLEDRGDAVKEGLADIRSLKVRLEQVFTRDGRDNLAVRNQIYNSFPYLGEGLTKVSGTI